jgi:hypothetical protein
VSRCRWCGSSSCYCCPECGRNVTHHAYGCRSDPERPRFQMPWALVYVDPQGWTRIEQFALDTEEELDNVREAVRRRMAEGLIYNCRLVNLNDDLVL